jgi:hypothetical protein
MGPMMMEKLITRKTATASPSDGKFIVKRSSMARHVLSALTVASLAINVILYWQFHERHYDTYIGLQASTEQGALEVDELWVHGKRLRKEISEMEQQLKEFKDGMQTRDAYPRLNPFKLPASEMAHAALQNSPLLMPLAHEPPYVPEESKKGAKGTKKGAKGSKKSVKGSKKGAKGSKKGAKASKKEKGSKKKAKKEKRSKKANESNDKSSPSDTNVRKFTFRRSDAAKAEVAAAEARQQTSRTFKLPAVQVALARKTASNHLPSTIRLSAQKIARAAENYR